MILYDSRFIYMYVVSKPYLLCTLELEWWTFENGNSVVFRCSNDAERSSWAEIYGIHRFGLATDLAHRRSSFRHEHMTESEYYKRSKMNL